MSSIQIFLPDNSVKQFDFIPTVLDVAKSIGERLAQDSLAAKVNSELVDIRTSLKNGDKIEIITSKSPEANEVIRHSAAHVMAQAVQELYPGTQVTIGPVIEDGFYYDFYREQAFTPDDLEKIEKKMNEIVSRKLPLVKEVWPAQKAIEFFKALGEHFKVEIIQDLKTSEVSIYKQGEWLDLCRGPHVQNTSQIKAVKVMSLAGAYWRGDENKAQLQRIYATAFSDKKDLAAYLLRLEEAKKRDHRKIGKELELFHFSQMSPGSPFFTNRGTRIYNELVNFTRSMYDKYGYQEVITPQVFDVEMFKRSGHYDNYAENMYFCEVEKNAQSFKPMNCPAHCMLYGMSKYSYRDLPLRIADFGRLHRFERSGVMHGLTRVRSFCQDDAHVFCTQAQLRGEIESFMKMLSEMYTSLGLTDYEIALSTRPEKRVGSEEVWDKAEAALASALESLGYKYKIQEGEGAFYGPKIEVLVRDAIGRSWQLGTAQCDFNMPERFGLSYVGDDNTEHCPVMLHRAILGSLERFIGVYLEHTAGKLPTWLCPVQVEILNVTDRQAEYCKEILQELQKQGVRAHYDSRNEKLGYKIREATLQRVPYMVIIGDSELENKKLSLRLRNGASVNDISVQEFVSTLKEEILNRSLQSPYEKNTQSNQEADN